MKNFLFWEFFNHFSAILLGETREKWLPLSVIQKLKFYQFFYCFQIFLNICSLRFERTHFSPVSPTCNRKFNQHFCSRVLDCGLRDWSYVNCSGSSKTLGLNLWAPRWWQVTALDLQRGQVLSASCTWWWQYLRSFFMELVHICKIYSIIVTLYYLFK